MRNFLVSTERGRVRGKISFYIAEIDTNGLTLIDNDYTCSTNSNRGIKNEAFNVLVNKNILPKDFITKSGHINHDKAKNVNLIIVEGKGLSYIDEIRLR